MAKILYFDAYSGLSGDMTLGALLYLGLPLDYLKEGLARLDLPGYRLAVRLVEQQHIVGLKLDVILEDTTPPHRSVSQIHQIIEAANLPLQVTERAKRVFWKLAVVEGKIHNTPPDAVHFHEVGAVDAIVDIVGACLGFEFFGIEEFYCSPLPLGSGFVRAAHGLMPVPAPATLELLAEWGATLTPTVILGDGSEYPARSEMVTPTGAALIATLCQPGCLPRPAMTLQGVGYGFGSREFSWPNALRLWRGETIGPHESKIENRKSKIAVSPPMGENQNLTQHSALSTQHFPLTPDPQNSVLSPQSSPAEVSLIETNLDDMTPEGLGYLLERLMQAEALDVYFTPIQMKKNRPAVMLSVLARPADEARLAAMIIAESSTFGVRCSRLSRYMAEREFRQIETPAGPAQVKLKIIGGKVVEAVPEYESVAALARTSGRPWREIYEEVKQHATQRGSGEIQV